VSDITGSDMRKKESKHSTFKIPFQRVVAAAVDRKWLQTNCDWNWLQVSDRGHYMEHPAVSGQMSLVDMEDLHRHLPYSHNQYNNLLITQKGT